eukprot:3818708-Amphidinium_carterae.1
MKRVARNRKSLESTARTILGYRVQKYTPSLHSTVSTYTPCPPKPCTSSFLWFDHNPPAVQFPGGSIPSNSRKCGSNPCEVVNKT